MSTTASSSPSVAYLKATYTSPTNAPLDLSTSLAFPFPTTTTSSSSPDPAVSVADKTSYLRALRAASSALQERVNAELTARMDEDSARQAIVTNGDSNGNGNGNGGSSGGSNNSGKKRKRANRKLNQNQGPVMVVPDVDEAAEEENYGEEVQDDDDDDN
ncbi:hypothetical protein F5X96DRAFT_627705 [Biscogniauxia mediterranea]|nr:hypothetical protein F5X96DRAFT_627705 [Biscogniauxia mediterranea]